jgi:hypothetical protein
LKEYLSPNFDPQSGKPINYKTDEPYPIDEKTSKPFDPQSGRVFSGLYHVYEGHQLHPKTQKEIKIGFDKETGRPLNQVTKELFPIEKESCRPYDPVTGHKYPGFFDPESGEPVDKDTKKVIKMKKRRETSQLEKQLPRKKVQTNTERQPT